MNPLLCGKTYHDVNDLEVYGMVRSSNVNEVIKTIKFFNDPKKLVFVRIEESTIIGLVGRPYLTIHLLLLGCNFVLLVCAKSFHKKKSLKLP